MSIADTLLLINDDPTKALNQHFDDSLTNLKTWLSDAIQYISSDNAIYVINDVKVTNSGKTVFEQKMKHSGSLRIKIGTVIPEKSTMFEIYINGINVAKNTTEFSFNKNDIVKIVMKATSINTASTISSISICGMPMLVDF